MKMPVFRWKGGDIWRNFKKLCSEKLFMLKLTYHSVFYNEFTSCGTILDTLIEPFIWCIEHFVRYLGPAFVTLIVCLVVSVVVVFYMCLMPHKLEESLPWTCVHLVCGHYFFYCTVFYYFRAAFTDPGHPPEDIPETVSICKRCIAPKPPRSHHCSVCNKCVLKMDHHCPWLNNCIGHNNHRYFMLFCTYMWLGTTYASAVAYPLFKQHFYGEDDGVPSGILYPFYALHMAIQDYRSRSDEVSRREIVDMNKLAQRSHHVKEFVVDDMESDDPSQLKFHTFVVYAFLLCSAVSVALFFLLAWHYRLVCRGETSIEYHINKKQKARLRRKGLVYKNPYDFGIVKNLEKLLGISKKSNWSFVKYVVIPSSHLPEENGLQWETNNHPVDRGLFLL